MPIMEKFSQNGSISERLKRIRFEVEEECIRYGRNPREVALMAVTKTRLTELVNEAMHNGADLAGENRVQELLSRKDGYTFLLDRVHFIGSLQTNKVKSLLPHVGVIESLDSLRLAKEIQKQAVALDRIIPCFVEININKEPAKGGILPAELSAFLDEMGSFPNLYIKGLMTIGAKGDDIVKKSENFEEMQRLFIDNKVKKLDNVNISVLSMGMSEDYLVAVRYGSNILRLGRVLFA